MQDSRTGKRDDGPSTYDDPRFNAWHAARVEGFTRTANVLHGIAAVIALPVMYALLARAAVVYSQRTNAKQTLNVRQLFALADGNFLRAVGRKPEHGGTMLANLGAVLIVLAAVTPILRSGLVRDEQRFAPMEGYAYDRQVDDGSITPIQGVSRGPGGAVAVKLAEDPSVAALAMMPTQKNVVAGLRKAMASVDWDESYPSPPRELMPRGDPDGGGWFATTVPQRSFTGIYRHLAMRLNSSTACEIIAGNSAAFDEEINKCWSAAPEDKFAWHFQLPGVTPVTVRVCAPQNPTRSPWRSPAFGDGPVWRDMPRHRLEAGEEALYIEVDEPAPESYNSRVFDINRVRCRASTTLGYFELGNHRNNNQESGLLPNIDSATDAGYLEDDDWSSDDKEVKEVEPSTYNPERNSPVSPGPLTLTAIALFGEDSALNTHLMSETMIEIGEELSKEGNRTQDELYVLDSISLETCDLATQALGTFFEPSFCGYLDDGRPYYRRHTWPAEMINRLLGAITRDTRDRLYDYSIDGAGSMTNLTAHMANQLLLQEAAQWDHQAGGYDIWSSVGAGEVPYLKPDVSLAGLIVLSILVGLQVIGILALCWYLFRCPTWTPTLDALAIARLTPRFRDGGYLAGMGLRRVDKQEPKTTHAQALQDVDALVGVVESSDVEMGPMPPAAADLGVHASRIPSWEQDWVSETGVMSTPAAGDTSINTNTGTRATSPHGSDRPLSSQYQSAAAASNNAVIANDGRPSSVVSSLHEDEHEARTGVHRQPSDASLQPPAYAPPGRGHAAPPAYSSGSRRVLDVGAKGLVKRAMYQTHAHVQEERVGGTAAEDRPPVYR